MRRYVDISGLSGYEPTEQEKHINYAREHAVEIAELLNTYGCSKNTNKTLLGIHKTFKHIINKAKRSKQCKRS